MTLLGKLTPGANAVHACGSAVSISVEQMLSDATAPDLQALFCKLLDEGKDRKLVGLWRAIAAHAIYDPKP